ncbi:hypothetical protein BKA67DRAFT_668012 [Truncatella angustata]|uniref:Aminoglycoside phosphotransferase domain-containing protein n=1 Tax=Truncatella angustata TaxID=152316 RepID=A0A9P8UYS6_9PEZI|nr:uncharacterized protein BKA67DRAFT_668012 [Truncatella angustata]KAH6661046.1 hypothetical protein BKA67DRAFT_668012 [Truncatella angustata]
MAGIDEAKHTQPGAGRGLHRIKKERTTDFNTIVHPKRSKRILPTYPKKDFNPCFVTGDGGMGPELFHELFDDTIADIFMMDQKNEFEPRQSPASDLQTLYETTPKRHIQDCSQPATPCTPFCCNRTPQNDHAPNYPQIGLRWEVNGFDTKVKWERKPRIESIKAVLEQRFGPGKDYEVKHICDGTYNKFYFVGFEGKKYVMKVTLPVCPRTKTEGEVTALRWTAANTNLTCLVPRVIDYSSSAKNPIGCEWILMTRLEGVPLSSCWREVSLGSKERIVKALAEYSHDTYRQNFRQIGNLFPAPLPCRGRRYQVGRISSMRLFWGKRLEVGSLNGPFRTSKEWTLRRLVVSHENLRKQFQSIKHWPDRQRNLWWRMVGISGPDSQLWRLHDTLFSPLKQNDEEGQTEGHEVRVIGSPKLLPSSLMPVSVQNSDEDDDSEDTDSDFYMTEEDDKHFEQADNEKSGEIRSDQTGNQQSGISPQRQSNTTCPCKQPAHIDADHTTTENDGQRTLPTTPSEIEVQSAIHRRDYELQRSPHQVRSNQDLQEISAQETSAEYKARLAREFGNWEPLCPDAEDLIQDEQNNNLGTEPTIIWHDNLSADNILVDPKAHTLTGILDWDCVSCLPVTLACDWPALLHEGKHRTTEPEIKDHVVFVPEDDREDWQPPFDPLNNQTEIREQQRGHLALRSSYWRAKRDFELTYLRKVFLQEMYHRCPAWYNTWKGSQVRKDYEAAVQNCDNEYMIHKVEAWVEAVEIALQKGQDIKAPQVPSLHCSIYEGPDWKDWADLDDLSAGWMKVIREPEKRMQQWHSDMVALEAAKTVIPGAKGAATNAARKFSKAKKDLMKLKEAFKQASNDSRLLEGLDHQGLDTQELERLRHEASVRLNESANATTKAEDKLAELELRAIVAAQKFNTALVKAMAAKEKVDTNREFQESRQEKEFNLQTWKNLEKALVKSYGKKKTSDWWEHRLEPLGYCVRKRKPNAVPRTGESSEIKASEDEGTGDVESEISEEE